MQNRVFVWNISCDLLVLRGNRSIVAMVACGPIRIYLDGILTMNLVVLALRRYTGLGRWLHMFLGITVFLVFSHGFMLTLLTVETLSDFGSNRVLGLSSRGMVSVATTVFNQVPRTTFVIRVPYGCKVAVTVEVDCCYSHCYPLVKGERTGFLFVTSIILRCDDRWENYFVRYFHSPAL